MKTLEMKIIITIFICGLLGNVFCDLRPRRVCWPDGSCITSPPHTTNHPRDVELGRLPEDVWPFHYNLDLRPDIYTGEPPFRLAGTVEIWIECRSPTNVIYVNQLGLDVERLEIEVSPDSPVQPPAPPVWTEVVTDDDLQFIYITLEAFLIPGAEYILTISYSTWMNDPATAFYWDSYQNEQGTTYIAATQFQPSYTRESIPVFDEPAFKATFNVTLQRKSHMTALSNAPSIGEEPREDDWMAEIFDTTPHMSNYLLCFAIVDYGHVEAYTESGVLVRIWAREDRLYAADTALQYAVDFQEFYEEYFGIPEVMPKMDHIALPSYTGAMENWGLITYREWFLLWDPDWSTTRMGALTGLVINHEVVHQWFGNLVTCSWWNNTWLNEGFANFFEHRALEEVLGWSWGEIQMVERIHPIMARDALVTSDPVRIDVDSPWDASTSFNSFTYSKGGTIVRLLMQILGEESFKRALTRYLLEHSFGSVETDDLWNALTEQAAIDGITDTDGSPLDFKEKMDPWVEQRGFPVVTVDREQGGIAHFYQNYFLNPPDQEVTDPTPWDYTWNIPLTFVSEENPEVNTTTKEWMDLENVTVVDDIPSNVNDWLLVNVEMMGFYIVNYDESNRRALERQLRQNHQVFSEENRGQLISDTFVLSRAGYVEEVDGFETTVYLDEELSYVPWVATATQTEYPALVLNRYPQTFPKMQEYMRQKVEPVYEHIGWTPEGSEPNDQLSLRVHILWLACTYGVEDCQNQAETQYQIWQQDINNNPVATDHRLTVYCTALRSGTQQDWDFAMQSYQLTALSDHPHAGDEVFTLLEAMSCAEDTDILQGYLQSVLAGELVTTSHESTALNYLADSDYGGRDVMWAHLKANWRDEGVVPEGISKHSVFSSVVNGFSTEADSNELDDFLSTYPAEDEEEQEVYDQAWSRVQDNLSWAATNQEVLDEWFEEHVSPDVIEGGRSQRVVNGGGHRMLLKHLRDTERRHPFHWM